MVVRRDQMGSPWSGARITQMVRSVNNLMHE